MSSYKSFMKWLPAVAVMSVIFWFSSQPSNELMNFGWLDRVVKKIGHILGYGALALSLWFGFDFRADRRWTVWLLAIVYAVTDEYHQSFVQGRRASWIDAFVFDNLGAMIALLLRYKFRHSKREEVNLDP